MLPVPSPGQAEPKGQAPVQDLSALSWVLDEIRRCLEAAQRLVRRQFKDREAALPGKGDLDAGPSALLRQAKLQVHQAVGALELVGLAEAATVLKAAEAALARLATEPALVTANAVQSLERTTFALIDWLSGRLNGRHDSAVHLFPQYRDMQQLAGAPRAHPADLWRPGLDWQDLPTEPGVLGKAPSPASLEEFEAYVLGLLRAPEPEGYTAMSALCAQLGAGAKKAQDAVPWRLAAAVFEAQSQGLLPTDAYTKRVASRLLAYFKRLVAGQPESSDPLGLDLLFFCANSAAPSREHPAPRLAAVRQAWQLTSAVPVNYEAAHLGRVDPATTALARKRLAAAKEAWQAVADGELHRAGSLDEHLELLADSLRRLFPKGEDLAQAFAHASQRSVHQGQSPRPELAMEVATAMLYLDAALEDGALDQALMPAQVLTLAQRIRALCDGSPEQAPEPWMEQLYRRVNERQTMGSVVQELRAGLAEVEKAVDPYFRDNRQRGGLAQAQGHLASMQGVLAILNLADARQGVQQLAHDIAALHALDATAPEPTLTCARVADNLGALSFLVDMLAVQPQAATSLFSFDADAGVIRAVPPSLPQTSGTAKASPTAAPPAPAFPPAHQPAAAPVTALVATAPASLASLPQTPSPAVDSALTQNLPLSWEEAQDLRQAAEEARVASHAGRHPEPEHRAGPAEPLAPLPPPPAAPTPTHPVPASAQTTALDLAPASVPASAPASAQAMALDDEMREVFLEEAQEVLQQAELALQALQARAQGQAEFTAVRRAFHTLKGSARMVGLADFGEAAWACEQLYNARLQSQPHMDGALEQFTAQALRYFGDWLLAIQAKRDDGHRVESIARGAQALGEQGQPPLASPVPQATKAPQAPASPVAPVSPVAHAAEPTPAPAPLPGGANGPASALRPDSQALVKQVPGLPHADELSFAAAAPAPAWPQEEESVKVIGHLRVPIALFNVFLNEADEHSRALNTELAQWRLQAAQQPAPEQAVALAHALAGNSATVGYSELSALARALEHALAHVRQDGQGLATAQQADALVQAADCIRRLLHQFAAGFLQPAQAGQMEAMAALLAEPIARVSEGRGPGPLEQGPATQGPVLKSPVAPGPVAQPDLAPAVLPDDGRGHDELDPDLFPIFQEEAAELLPRLQAQLRRWHEAPEDSAAAAACMRSLHTLKGGARLAGAMRLGELAHELESHVQAVAAQQAQQQAVQAPQPHTAPRGFQSESAIEPLVVLADELCAHHEALAAHFAQGEALAAPPSSFGPSAFVSHGPQEPVAQGAVRAALAEPGAAPERQEHSPGAASSFSMIERAAARAETTGWGELSPDADTHIQSETPEQGLDGQTLPAPLVPPQGQQPGFVRRTPQPYPPLPGHLRDEGATVPAPVIAPAPEPAPEPAPQPAPQPDAAPATMPAPVLALAPAPALVPMPVPVPVLEHRVSLPTPALPPAPAQVDWSRFAKSAPSSGAMQAAALARDQAAARAERLLEAAQQQPVRVRAGLLDRLVSHAGEVSITRERMSTEMRALQAALGEMNDSMERMRRQLRDIEVQAETQINSRLETQRAAGQNFDPLEMDRFTRFQELTRFMAESVNDVGTLQRTLQRTLQATEDELAAQARLTRELQSDLLRTRMVHVESQAERLYRTVRQAAKETGKPVRLDIVGGNIEVDRGVLDRMLGAFEHLLRNSVVHGIEAPAQRANTGKPLQGHISIQVAQSGNEVAIAFADDGAGFHYPRIRARAVQRGLLAADANPSEAELAQLLFAPGFSTAEAVSELAGRGVGLDVVRDEVNAMGGRIETQSVAGKGASFTLVLPLTTAVTQVVNVRCGELDLAIPSTLVEAVRRVRPAQTAQAYASGQFEDEGRVIPFYWLPALVQAGTRGSLEGRAQAVVVVRSAAQRVAVHVGEVLGNQEVVVKHVGPQLARLPGLVGVTLMPTGAIALIYNPVALAAVFGSDAHALMRGGGGPFAPSVGHDAVHVPASAEAQAGVLTGAPGRPQSPSPSLGSTALHGLQAPMQPPSAGPQAGLAPMVLVVDDSLTVRRVTQRLLTREGYRVVLAKDGMEALERLAQERPAVLLTDIEMPRMDGFDLVRNVRADARLAGLPVVMITSRIAQKHRDYAIELGVNHYLGKPYGEEELLGLVGRYSQLNA